MVLARLTPSTQLEFFYQLTTPIFTSGATPERARLEGVIPFQARVHLPWERLPGSTPVCDGSDPIHTGAVPKTEHNEGADPKNRAEKVEHCFAARLLVCLPPLLSGLLSCGAPCLSVLVGACLSWRVSVMRFSRGRATTPEPITFGKYSLTKLDSLCYWQL